MKATVSPGGFIAGPMGEAPLPPAGGSAGGELLVVAAPGDALREATACLRGVFPIRFAATEEETLSQALAHRPRAILLNLGKSGECPAVLRAIRGHSVLRIVPVVAFADDHEQTIRGRLQQHDVQLLLSRSAAPESLLADLQRLLSLERAVPGQEERHQALLNAIDQGFCIIKMLFDAGGHPVDYRFVEVNDAFEHQTGLVAAQGKRMRELAPAHEEHWFEAYGRVAVTREPARFEQCARQLNRWFEVFAFPYGPPGDQEVGILFRDITSRKLAEAESEKAARFRQMAMRVGRVGAWSLDVSTMAMEWSDEARAIHGLPDDCQVSLEAAIALTDLKWRDQVRRAADSCITRGVPFDLEVCALTWHGDPLWIRLIGEAVRGSDGAVKRIQGAVQDITALQSASRRARDLSDQLGETLESMTDAFFTLSRDWRFMYVNGEGERLLRRSRAELVGRVIWEEFPDAIGTAAQREYERAAADFVSVEFEMYSVSLDTWLQMRICPSERGLAVYFQDVSERKRTEGALADSEEQYRLLFEHSLDGILQARPDGSIVRANRAACDLFRMTQRQIVHAGEAALVAPGDERRQKMLQERQQSGSAQCELTLVRGDGTRFEAEVASAQYRASSGEVRTFLVVRDITERLQARDATLAANTALSARVRQRTSELEEANRELKAFAHSLAHDVRAPIAAVKAFTQLAARSLPAATSAQARGYLARAREATTRMDEYMEALLSLARLSRAPMKIEPVDLSAMARDVLAQLRQRDPGRQAELMIQEGVTADGDRTLLRMLLENLLGNAWKFTSRRPAAVIQFLARRRETGVLVYEVSDNGAGFDMAQEARLFGSFQRLHSETEFPGTGVGLANVQRIVTRHGGRVWAESAVDQGASFFFTLEGPAPAA